MAENATKSSEGSAPSVGLTPPERRTPLALRQPVEGAPGTLRLAELPFAGKFILRLDPASGSEAFREAAGLDLPAAPLMSVVNGERVVFWLGPDEFLLLVPEAEAAAFAEAVEKGLADQHHQLVDVSDYYTAIEISGRKAREALMKLTTLDLHPRGFPVGHVAGSNFARAQGWLWLEHGEEETARFRLYVRWSMAEYLWCVLADAGREWGVPEQVPAADETFLTESVHSKKT
ncbi:sarcosine oxidase subunit gamma [Rhodopseudomonas julia]|uniref:Sarcosine oxidase subunit gamma n=1 Tax=Rhodopseudomonas julia TaxID=200617 RepID=A0ABU0C1R9_9BRAD|nr:sarcosine oxidase subunit gamma family protein [Rhodopseudomonas julia]MDQ0324463.1 sarcosine oxidase subunit gamma [Rhodopseudomonas julia]